MISRVRALTVAVALTALLAPQLAAAQLRLRGTATVALGATDNALAQPQSPGPGEPGPQADGFASLSPGVDLFYISSHAALQLRYAFSGLLYFERDELNTYTNQLRSAAVFQTSRLTRLLLGLTAAQGLQRTLGLIEGGAAGVLGARPATEDTNLLTFSADQGFEWDLTPRATLAQSAVLTTLHELRGGEDPPLAWQLDAALGGRYRWSHDALGLQARAGYFSEAEVGEARQQQLIPSLVLSWFRDLDEHWNLALGVGVVAAVRLDEPDRFVHPTARAALRLDRARSSAELSAQHAVEPNLLVGANFLREQLSIVGSHVPDRRELWRLTGGIAYEYGRSLLTEDAFSDGVHVVRIDLGVTWQAWRHATLNLGYRFDGQIGAVSGADAGATLTQHLVQLGTTLTYPAPDRGRPRLRPSRRVDRREWERLFRQRHDER